MFATSVSRRVVSSPLATSNQVRLAATVVTHHVLQPGWSWEEHDGPLVGTAPADLTSISHAPHADTLI
jgi:hypothetical protein